MRLLGVVVLLSIILLGIGGGSYAYSLNHWFYQAEVVLEQPVTIEIKRGQSFSAVASLLESEGLIADPFKFSTIARLKHKTQSLKVGEYQFVGQVTPHKVLGKIERGDGRKRRITFQEGRVVKSVWKQLAKAEKVHNNVLNLTHDEVLERLDLHFEASHLEGLLFPDTYSYLANNTALSILQRAHDKLWAVLADAWEKRSDDVQAQTEYELLIVASIIEKESNIRADRFKISGVIHRRLQRGIRLQVDPTVIYGLGEEFDGNLRREHLRAEQIYNTYVHYGLPPTPICMPSKESIVAAANPRPGEEMYFVGRGDGTSQFSVTLQEHNRAVRKYQMK